jgi:hypothetical protein
MMKRKPIAEFLVILCLVCLALGCAGKRKTPEPVFREQEPSQTEAPEQTIDPSRFDVKAVTSKEGPFEHPFTVSEQTLQGLLRALYFQQKRTFRWKNPERVMDNAEAAQLARKIEPTFATLSKDQLVRFRLTTKKRETKGELFVKEDYLNIRMLVIRNYTFLKKGTKSTSHQWKLDPQEGQGFFPSRAVVWNPKEATNWIVVRVSDLSSLDIEGKEAPADKSFIERIDVFP